MAEQFKINVPEGMEIDLEQSDLSTGNIFFKKEEIKLPITNIECEEFIKEDGYYVDVDGSIAPCFENASIDKNFITTKEYAEAFLALMQLVKFRDIWNDGWVADWRDRFSKKYAIYFGNGEKLNGEVLNVSDLLNFKTAELRDKFSEQFDDLIHIAKPLL